MIKDTPGVRRVLEALIDLSAQDITAFSTQLVGEKYDISYGTVSNVLSALKREEWMTNRPETLEERAGEPRPFRVMYEWSDTGHEQAVKLLAPQG